MKLKLFLFSVLFIFLFGCSKDEELASSENNLVNLISPVNGAILDNGCKGQSDLTEWYFDWEHLPNAQKYQLYVIGPTARYPVIDNNNIKRQSIYIQVWAILYPRMQMDGHGKLELL